MKATVRKGFYLHLHDKIYNPGESVELSEAEYKASAHMLEGTTEGTEPILNNVQLGMDLPPELEKEGIVARLQPETTILEDVGSDDPEATYKVSKTTKNVQGKPVEEGNPLLTEEPENPKAETQKNKK